MSDTSTIKIDLLAPHYSTIENALLNAARDMEDKAKECSEYAASYEAKTADQKATFEAEYAEKTKPRTEGTKTIVNLEPHPLAFKRMGEMFANSANGYREAYAAVMQAQDQDDEEESQ
jgi:hypothetical protein